MSLYIGADLGTSALKLSLITEEGEIRKEISRSYPVSFPQSGWSEQEPAHWWEAFTDGIGELLQGENPLQVRAIGAGGQMHGLVALDEKDQVIRPAILWNDGRTDEETAYLNEKIGKARLSELTANIAFAGFTAPKILWMQKHEPENFKKISKIMLPKDYLNYLLTGVHATDYSDASGMLLLDVEHRCWSAEMMEICAVREDQLPRLFESAEVIGTLKPEIAEKFGLSPQVLVVAGAGDNAAAAIGTGTVKDGSCNISLGTSGTMFIASDSFAKDEQNALHAFCHANGNYHLMACILSAASCNKWFCEEILKAEDFGAEQALIKEEQLGRNEIFFLPYLMGERSPINDTDAKGAFIGMRMDTTRAEMVQAVLEGVGFALRDNLEIAKAQGIAISESGLCGGGAKSPLWQKIIANILNLPLLLPETEQGPGFGGAILAMIGAGAYQNAQEAAQRLIKIKSKILPDPQIAARYEERYLKFKKIYPALKNFYKGE